jgi:hypothetical protein
MRGDIRRVRLLASTPARDFRLHAAYDGGVSFGDDHGSRVPPSDHGSFSCPVAFAVDEGWRDRGKPPSHER